jgi:hypothetical protein
MGPAGPEGRFPDDPNRPFPGGQQGRFRGGPGEPNEPFIGGFRARGGFRGNRGGQFPEDPNMSFAGGRRGPGGRGGFGGGPGGPFGRGGNLLEQMALKTNENSPDYNALFRFLEVLNNCPEETFPSEIEKVLDVDGVLRFLAVSVLIVHLDN